MIMEDVLTEMYETLAQAQKDMEDAIEALDILKELRVPHAEQTAKVRKLQTDIIRYEAIIRKRIEMHQKAEKK